MPSLIAWMKDVLVSVCYSWGMISTETIAIVTRLQKTSAEVFKATEASLVSGMTEVDIADLIRQEYKKRGVSQYWYDVPINVLIGAERFKVGITTSDYVVKSPSKDVHIVDGSPVFIDLSPVDSETGWWGDWAATLVFHPRRGIDDEQVSFIREMRHIHRQGFADITALTTGADVAKFYLSEYGKIGATLLDVRNNVGHSMHRGPKSLTERVWLDESNTEPLGEGIFTVEPGGCRAKQNGEGAVMARFEDCIYIPPKGTAAVLGN